MTSLSLELLSPELSQHFEIRYLSVKDSLGRLGIQPGHHPYLTPLQQAVGYFDDLQGQRHYLAHDTGVLRVEAQSHVYVMARVILLGANLEELQSELERRVRRATVQSEQWRQNLHNLEKMLFTQMSEAELLLFGGQR